MDTHSKWHSLQFRIVASIFLVVIIPVLLLLFFALRSQSALAEEKAMESSRDRVEQSTELLNSYFKRIISAEGTLDLNENLSQFLAECNSGSYDGSYDETRLRLLSILDESSAAMSDIYVDLMIITNSGDIYGTSPLLYGRPPYSLEHTYWYPQIKDRYTVLWMQSQLFDYMLGAEGSPNVYIARQLFDTDLYTPVGVLIFSLSQSELEKIYRGSVSEYQSVYLLDEDNSLISSIDNLSTGAELPGVIKDVGLSYTRSSIDKIDGTKVFIAYDTIDCNQWKLVQISDYNVWIASEQTSPIFLAAILLYCFLAAFIITGMLNRSIFLPLRRLRSYIFQVEQGDFNTEMPLASSDEIGALAQSFNSMTKELDRLFKQVVAEQNMKRESDMKALQSQINPHFIYNTLSSIRYLILVGDKEKADSTVLSLIKLLKNILSSSKTLVTVSFEISQLKEYLNIQQLALSQELTVTFDIDERIRDCLVNRLLLQPIVENAVMHGIKPKNAPGTVTVSGRPEGEDIVFTVTDDGLGFDASVLENESPKYFAERDHIGVKNVDQRIKLYFGDKYGVSIDSRPGEGARVTIRIPQITQEEGASIHEYNDC